MQLSRHGISEVRATIAPSAPARAEARALPADHAAKISDIQVLRAVAIGLVLAAHLSITDSLLMAFPFPVQNPGWIGVELFFVVSGYVVTRSLALSNFSLVAFVVRRVFRLYPLMLVFIAAGFAATTFCRWIAPPAPPVFVPSWDLLWQQSVAILLWTFPAPASGVSYVNSAAWSLTVELKFYTALAAYVALLACISRERAFLRNGLLIAAVTIYLTAFAARALSGFGISFAVGDMLTRKCYEFIALGVVAAVLPAGLLERIAGAIRPLLGWLIAAALLVVTMMGAPRTP